MAKRLFSILTEDMDTCFLTGTSYWIERHHIFGGAYRKASELEGMVIPVTHDLHNEKNGIHHNQALNLQLKQYAQRKYEETHTREEFMLTFGRNYIYDEENDGWEIDLRACGVNIPYFDEAC